VTSVPRPNSLIRPASAITSSGCPSRQASQACAAVVRATYMVSLPAAASARGISVRTASVSCWRSAVRVSASRLYTRRWRSPMRSPIASAFSSCC
jgi:hypothetical protein